MAGVSAGDALDSREAGPRIIRGGVLRIAGYGAGSLLSVLSIALLTRHLGTGDFGRYATVFALIAIITGLVDAGTASIGVREYALREARDGRAFLAQLLGMRLALAGAGGIGALGFALAAGYDGEMVAGTAVAAVGLLLTVLAGTMAIVLQSTLRLGWVTSLDFLRQAATVLALVVAILAGAGLVPLLAVPIPVGVVVLVATIALLRGHAPMRPRADRAEWRRVVVLALPFAMATAVGIVYANVTVIAMSLATSDTETGLFSAAFRVYFVLATIPGLLVASAFPLLARAARDDRERLRYAVQRMLEITLILGTGMALVTALGAPAAIDVVAGADYRASTDVLRVMALALLGTHLIALGGFALLSVERYRALLVANAIALSVSAGLTFALAPSLGADGAAIAVVAGDSVLGTLYFVALRRGDGIALTWRIVGPVVLATGAGAGLALISGLPAVPAAALAGLVFAGVLLALRAVPTEVFEAFRR